MKTGITELVILALFFRIGEHGVCFCQLFELVFGVLVIGVFVRVILLREFTIGFFYRGGIGITFDTEYRVIIFGHDANAPVCYKLTMNS